MSDTHPDPVLEDIMNPETTTATSDDDARSDIEQAVEARADAIERGEGGPEP